MTRRTLGSTMIKLLAAVIGIGTLVGLGVVQFNARRESNRIFALKSDVVAVAALQASFKEAHGDYAGGAISTGTPDTTGSGAGQVVFTPNDGNIIDITWRSNDGYAAVASNPATSWQCGVFVGEAGNSPNAAVTTPGVPGCWEP